MSQLPPKRLEQALALLGRFEEPRGLLGDVIADAEKEIAEHFGIVKDLPAELHIRLEGERATGGFYDPAGEAELSGPLRRELSAALGKAKKVTRRDLVEISKGASFPTTKFGNRFKRTTRGSFTSRGRYHRSGDAGASFPIRDAGIRSGYQCLR